MTRVKCLECGAILESTHRHDFRRCNCHNETFIDGGNDYTRTGGLDLSKVKVLKEEIVWVKKDASFDMSLGLDVGYVQVSRNPIVLGEHAGKFEGTYIVEDTAVFTDYYDSRWEAKFYVMVFVATFLKNAGNKAIIDAIERYKVEKYKLVSKYLKEYFYE